MPPMHLKRLLWSVYRVEAGGVRIHSSPELHSGTSHMLLFKNHLFYFVTVKNTPAVGQQMTRRSGEEHNSPL